MDWHPLVPRLLRLPWSIWATNAAMALKRFLIATTKACVAALRILWGLPLCVAAQASTPPETTIWFDTPATNFTESTPLGNGRLGAMMFGGFDEERIVLNESSVWSGSHQDADRPDA